MGRLAWARAGALAMVIALTACERAKAPSRGVADVARFLPSTAPVASSAGTMRWDDEFGAFLATPSLDGGAPVEFVRDSSKHADLQAELFSHDDHTSLATLQQGAGDPSCASRRSATLIGADGRGTPGGWSLALVPGVAVPIGIDAVSDLLPRDSAAMVARISRLVSAIPEDSLSTPFRGLPIVVRDAWRFQLADSTPVNVAIALRSLNVESNPRVEAITLIAEPDPSAGPAGWRTAFVERVAGPEDRVEGMDLLAAFRLRASRPVVAFVREGDAGVQLQIVERTAPGRWNVRWASPAPPCRTR